MLRISIKAVKIVLSALALGWVCVAFILYFFQDQLVFPGTRINRITHNREVNPYSLYFIQSSAGNIDFLATFPKPDKPIIVVFHGNGEIGADSTQDFLAFQKLGFGIVLAEYRGYGGNVGLPSEQGIIQDGLAQVEWAQKQWPNHPLVLWGSSLGTFVAASLEHQVKPMAIILDSPFTSVKQAAQYHFPIIPVSFLIKAQFDSFEKIKKFTTPTMIIYGGQDTIIPPYMGKLIFNQVQIQCSNAVKELYFENTAHKVLTNGPTQIVEKQTIEFIYNIQNGMNCFK